MRAAHVFESPLGPMLAVLDGAGALTHLEFLDQRSPDELLGTTDDVAWSTDEARAVAAQLGEYFARTRKTFTLRVAPAGTEFQQGVWRALQDIPYGVTTSYQAIANGIGNPRSTRAVGRANGSNPVAIVIPCHRVIGAGGSLVGYGGGMARKEALLELEGARVAQPRLL